MPSKEACNVPDNDSRAAGKLQQVQLSHLQVESTHLGLRTWDLGVRVEDLGLRV